MTNASEAGVTFQPSEDWIDEFKKQCTEALRLDLCEYAKRRARGVGRAGAHVDDLYAEDLVADALADTLFGVVAWDPKSKSLHQHGEDTIRYRTRHDRRRARRYKHQRLDAPASQDEHATTRGLVEASLLQSHCGESSGETAIFATEVLSQIRKLAAADPPVLRCLDVLVGGAQTRTEIMENARLSAKEFRNTRDRLSRLVEQLDQNAAPARTRGVRA